MADILELQFKDIAKQTNDPCIYIMVLLNLGFRKNAYRKLANKCWNQIHPDKKLPPLNYIASSKVRVK